MERRTIGKAAALSRARETVEAHGLPWEEPVKVSRPPLGIGHYTIWTNWGMRDGMLRIHVDARSGEVTRLQSVSRHGKRWI
jgi:hypothetical protein